MYFLLQYEIRETQNFIYPMLFLPDASLVKGYVPQELREEEIEGT